MYKRYLGNGSPHKKGFTYTELCKLPKQEPPIFTNFVR